MYFMEDLWHTVQTWVTPVKCDMIVKRDILFCCRNIWRLLHMTKYLANDGYFDYILILCQFLLVIPPPTVVAGGIIFYC